MALAAPGRMGDGGHFLRVQRLLLGVKRVPFRLPELIEALAQNQLVFIVEGEKDVSNCRNVLGAPATCNPMGAGKWPKMAADLNPYFTEADVVVIADHHQAGHDHAQEVAMISAPPLRAPALARLTSWNTYGGSRRMR